MRLTKLKRGMTVDELLAEFDKTFDAAWSEDNADRRFFYSYRLDMIRRRVEALLGPDAFARAQSERYLKHRESV